MSQCNGFGHNVWHSYMITVIWLTLQGVAACIYILHMELVISVPTDAQDDMVLDHLLIASDFFKVSLNIII